MITSKIVLRGLKSGEQKVSLSVHRKVTEEEAEQCREFYGAKSFEIIEWEEEDQHESNANQQNPAAKQPEA